MTDGSAADVLDVTGRRVLIVGVNYAPEHAGIAPYTTALAEQLAASGNEVLVLAGPPSYPAWRVDEPYRGRRVVEEERNGVTVRRLWHYVPRRPSALRRGAYEATFGAHVLAHRLPWAPDHVVAVVPSLLGSLAAARLAQRHGAQLTVWVQDLMSAAAEQSGTGGGRAVSGLTGRAERGVLAAADRVCVVTEAFRSPVLAQGACPDRVDVVPNWTHIPPPRRERRETRELLGWPEDTTVALHTGNMGYKQALENVVDAAREADRSNAPVLFVLMGDGSQRAALEQRARDVERLDFCDPVPDDLYSDALAAADVLLVNERASVRSMSLPSKLTSYLVAGRPIVAAVPGDGSTAREVSRQAGAQLIEPMDSPGLLAAVLAAAGGDYACIARERERLEPSAREPHPPR